MPTTNVVPSAPAHAVDRPLLRERLDGALDAPLTLVVAPAGSGKTVLLSQWAASRTDLRFVWVGLEPADDDPIRFARKLLGRLTTLDPAVIELGPLLAIGGGGLGQPLLEQLSTVLADHPGLVLVFDDLHTLLNRALIDDLWWLADHLPASAHMVFSSRGDRRLALSRHRLRYSLLELREAELAFDDDVAAEVLGRIAGVAATTATVASVMDTTEGWAAGVQLTAISLRHQPDPEMFARRLAGSDRLISDYLSEEVLVAQSDERRELLLRLSALDRMTPALVESVLEVPDAAKLFDELERDSMFLVTIDDRHEWFRFHHLFRDLLRYRLRARYPDDEARIVSAAAEWFVQQGDVPSAIEGFVQARSWDRAIDLILSRGREVFERGQSTSVAQWLSAIPDAVRAKRPSAETLYGIVLGMSGQAALAEDVLRRLVARPGVEAGLILIADAYISARTQFRPQVTVSIEAARESLRMLRALPDVDTARPDRSHRSDPPRGDHSRFSRPVASLRRRSARGRARAAARAGIARRAVLGLPRPPAGLAGASGGVVGQARGRPEAGRRGAAACAGRRPARAPGAGRRIPGPLARGDPSRPPAGRRARAAGGRRARRIQRPDTAHVDRVSAQDPRRRDARSPLTNRPSRRRPSCGTRSMRPNTARAAWPVRRSRLRRTSAGGLPCSSKASPPRWRRSGPPTRGLCWMPHRSCRATDLPLASIEHAILTGWLAHTEGRAAESRKRVTEALELAAEHGIVSAFVWAGPEVIKLVEAMALRSTPFHAEVLDCAREHLRSSPDALLSEPLTDRERELLAYLPTRLTNAELASRFFVSVNTIKTHMAHIYRKLDAPNRSAAVARATELGLL